MNMSTLSNTETPNEKFAGLEQFATFDLVRAFVDDQHNAVSAVQAAAHEIARAIEAAVPRVRAGGRIIYVGAGTSGRLGLLDSVELNPTFSWPDGRAIALLAGGEKALYRAVEGAEDSREMGAADIAHVNVTEDDVVLLLAASGSTPYVIGATEAARARGALTIGVANNPGSAVASGAEHGITLDTGAEVISGSTRLKAGTAQKIFLNTFSSCVMVRLNKVYGNLMVDVRATNAKLIQRCVNLTVTATGASATVARDVLTRCDFQVKVAIVSIKTQLSIEEARKRLAFVDGSVRAALELSR
jgi:N-acetylmuramic acid 6-phosphate etherase